MSVRSSGVTAVAAGAYHIAVKDDNVCVWGSSTNGQLGDGTQTSRSRPKLIDPAELNNIVAVAAGVGSSYALSADGSLWVWGWNANTDEPGLGDSALGHHLTPQHLPPTEGFIFTSVDADAGYAGNFLITDAAVVATLAPIPEPSSGLSGEVQVEHDPPALLFVSGNERVTDLIAGPVNHCGSLTSVRGQPQQLGAQKLLSRLSEELEHSVDCQAPMATAPYGQWSKGPDRTSVSARTR